MKKLILLIALCIASNSLFAQQGINYKAVISDNGNVLQNQTVDVQFSILNELSSTIYQEIHTTTTDNNGIIILNIGEGTVISGLFNQIYWDETNSLKVEIDTGSGYEDFGITEFKAVPYAKYANDGDWPKRIGQLADGRSDIVSLYLGNESGSSETDSNLSNTSVGHFSLRYNQTGYGNSALGTYALIFHETGDFNSAIGESSLANNIIGSQNTALGFQTGQNSTGSGNVLLGYQAGQNETGDNKLYIENSNSATPLIGGDFSTDEVTINGSIAIIDGTEGTDKVLTSDANGKASWQTIDAGSNVSELNDLSDAVFDGQSLYLGLNAGINDDNSNYNTAVGWRTMAYNTSGRQNATLGAEALLKNETGSYNVALGTSSLYNIVAGNNNVAIGEKAGFNALGDGNIFIGKNAGLNEVGSNMLYIENSDSITPLIGGDFSTDEVTINGSIAIVDGTEGTDKVLTSDANGKASWQTINTSGATAINELSDGISDDSSVFLGQYSGINDDTTGNQNTGIGVYTLTDNTTGYANNAVGFSALRSNTTGFYNSANGYGSLIANTTGRGNSVVGTYALYSNTTGNYNVAIGQSSGYNSNNTYNVFIGYRAGYLTTGDSNIFIGNKAGYNETGSNKLYIENSESSTPLIGGDFSTNEVDINGQLAVTNNISASTGYIGNSGYSRFTVDGDPINGELIRFKTTNITPNADVLDLEIPTAPSTGTSQFIEANTENSTVFKVDHTGDIYTKGELHSENSGDADMKALVYGTIYEDGAIASDYSSDGFSASRISAGKYYIDINNATDRYFLPVATISSQSPKVITYSLIATDPDGRIRFSIFDFSGNAVDAPFSFVIYKK